MKKLKRLLLYSGLFCAFTPAMGQVTLYQHCNYGGWTSSFAEGSYPLSALSAAGGANDDVSSLKVAAGYKVTFYADNNFLGASLVKTGDDDCLVNEGWNDVISSFKVEKTTLAEPPLTWQEHWLEHVQLLSRVYYDNDLAVYYDNDVSRSVTWPNTYLGDVWRYTKKVYGSFGSDPRLFAVFHTNKYSGGHPATYFDASHDYRNVIDVGPGPWFNGSGNDLDLTTHEVAHIVEGASKGYHNSPAFGIWGDSKWAEIFNYDVYRGLNRTNDVTRWYNLMINNSDNFPRQSSYWFRDWFYPIYTSYGGSAALNRYFELLAQYFPKNGRDYSRGMNWGEFVHFWSGAAGVNLKEQATFAFGWSAERETQFNQARSQFPFTYGNPTSPARVATLCQNLNYGGYAIGLPAGNYTTADMLAAGIGNNDITSLRLNSGYQITLYDGDNFTGASITKTADDATLVDDTWNDRASSFIIRAVGSARVASAEADLTEATGLTLHPNPAVSGAQVTFTFDTPPGDVTLWVSNQKGNSVFSQTYSSVKNTLQIDLPTLPAGLYFFKVNGEGRSWVRKYLVTP